MVPTGGTLTDVRDALEQGELRSEEFVQACLGRIETLDPTLNAFTQVFAESALVQAREIDRRREAGDALGPLAGIPIAIKDNICTTEGKTTCASQMLSEYRSPFSATVVNRLIGADAIIIGKTNLDEFAMGSSTEHSCFGPTKNPWEASRVPGGSSGGSAAAVAARIVPGALGSDTGGSVRQPAALCGCVGFKPTYGRVSRYGLVAFASSLDQIGTLTRSVGDAALLASIISGHDPLDATSIDALPIDFHASISKPKGAVRIGVPALARDTRNAPSVADAVDTAIAALRETGATIIEDVELPHIEVGLDAYYVIALAEASSNLARYDGVRYGRRAQLGPEEDLIALYERSRAEGFGAEVQRRIMLGTHVLSSGYHDAYYLSALKVRRLIAQDFAALFTSQNQIDAVLMPVTTGPAFKIGAKRDDPLSMYLEDLYTVPANLAGLPAVSIPVLLSPEGLPIGVQLVGPALGDEVLLQIAQATEGCLSPMPAPHCNSL